MKPGLRGEGRKGDGVRKRFRTGWSKGREAEKREKGRERAVVN
jgi:hypothetical protein